MVPDTPGVGHRCYPRSSSSDLIYKLFHNNPRSNPSDPFLTHPQIAGPLFQLIQSTNDCSGDRRSGPTWPPRLQRVRIASRTKCSAQRAAPSRARVSEQRIASVDSGGDVEVRSKQSLMAARNSKSVSYDVGGPTARGAPACNRRQACVTN